MAAESQRISPRDRLKTWTKEHNLTPKSIGVVGAMGVMALAGCGGGGSSHANAEHVPTAPTTTTGEQTPGPSETSPATTSSATTSPATTETAPSPEAQQMNLANSVTFEKLDSADQKKIEQFADPSYSIDQFCEQDVSVRAKTARIFIEANEGPFRKAAMKYVLNGQPLGDTFVRELNKKVNGFDVNYNFAMNTPAKDINKLNNTAPLVYLLSGEAEAYHMAATGDPGQLHDAKIIAAGLVSFTGSQSDAMHGDILGTFKDLDRVSAAKSDPDAIERYPQQQVNAADMTSTLPTWLAVTTANPDIKGHNSYTIYNEQFTVSNKKSGVNVVPAWVLQGNTVDPSVVPNVAQ